MRYRILALLAVLIAVPQTCAHAQASTKRIPVQKDGPRRVASRMSSAADSVAFRAQTDSIRALANALRRTGVTTSEALLARAKTLDSIAAIPPLPPIPDTVRVTVQLPAPPAVHDTVHDTVTVIKVYHDTVRVTPPPVITPPVVPPVVNPPPAANSPAALPQDSVDVTMPVIIRRVPVPAGTSLQAALNTAQSGDALVLDSAGVWTGNYSLPARSAGGWVIVTTNGSLPPLGTRVALADTIHMPTIVALGVAPAIATQAGTSGWRLIGLHVRTSTGLAPLNFGLVTLGTFQQTTLAAVPSNIVLDRMVIRAPDQTQTSRCVSLSSAHSAIIDSYLSDCKAAGSDAQAVLLANGPGPYLLRNNRLEGSGENVMSGGVDPAIPGLRPADLIIRRNYFTKPLAWSTTGCGGGKCSVKNLLEFKNVARALVEGNVFENSWLASQTGTAVTAKSTNQNGACTWCQTSDVTFRYNLIHDVLIGFNIAARPEAQPAVPAARILVEHNLVTNIGASNGTCGGRVFQLLDDLDAVTIRNNTTVHVSPLCGSASWVLMDSGGKPRATNLVIQGNVTTWGGPYGGLVATGKGGGTASLAAFASTYTYSTNCIVGLPLAQMRLYPAGTIQTGLPSDVFMGPTDFHVKPSSPCAALGADIDAVLRATAGVVP